MPHLPNPVPITRQLSQRVVMETILHQAPVSRADVARVTGLSKQTVSEVVRTLEGAGWVRETGRTQGAVGRSAVTYEVDRDAAFVLGVDLGGTKVMAALADLACTVRCELVEPTDAAGGPAIVDQIGRLRRRLVASAGIDPARLRLAVIGSPGVLDPATGAVRLAPNIPGFGGFDVQGALAATLGCPTIVENDVNLGVIGEHWQGAGAATMAYLAIGTGVGAGLLIDGKLVRGARGAAGEISYLPLGGDPFDPTLRAQGALEAAVGAAGIGARYAAHGGGDADIRTIFDRAAAGEAAAAATLAETARLVALGIAAIAAVVDPERVVLGGSIGLRTELADAVARALACCMLDPPAVETSALAGRATLVGALAVGLSQLHNTLFAPDELPGDLALPAGLGKAPLVPAIIDPAGPETLP